MKRISFFGLTVVILSLFCLTSVAYALDANKTVDTGIRYQIQGVALPANASAGSVKTNTTTNSKTVSYSMYAETSTSSLPALYEKRFNCGGPAYTAVNGDFYEADQGYTPANGAGAIGGVGASTTIPIDGTVDDPLYQTARRGGDFQYRFDVANGWYKVKFQFAEIVQPDVRSFLVLINGSVVKSFFASSVSAAAGGMYKAYDLEFFTNVTNGQIIVWFQPASGKPGWDVTGIINAISVITAKPPSTGPVQVSGRQILVGSQPFTIKGVCYQPIPVGYGVLDYNIYTDPNIYNRDFALLQQMNCNSIRTWGKVGYYDQGSFLPATGFMDAASANSIKVIMGFYVDGSLNLADAAVRQSVIDEFKAYVNMYKDHPAVLMWAIGNENNYWYSGDKKDWYSLVNEMAWAAYEVEGATYHPVTTPNGDIWNGTGPIGNHTFNTDDASMPFLDVWGANIYSGWSFQGRIQNYAGLSSKPFWISEYGFPGTDQRNQASGAYVLWDEIANNSSICSGGTIMEYSDEWWKSGNPARHDDSSGVEFFGVVGVEDNGSAADIMHPKLAYYTLQNKWGAAGAGNLALHKNAVASHVEWSAYVATNATDGNLTTRWSSFAQDGEWIYVDLGATHDVGKIVLRWEAAYATRYNIQVSNDAVNWTTVYTTPSDKSGGIDIIYLDNLAIGRYVKMQAITRVNSAWGISLWEFEIYERIASNADLNKNIFTSSVEGPAYAAANAVDGNYNSRWSSNQSADPQWIYVDLGGYYSVSQVVLRWEDAYATSYKIQRSIDGSNWYDVYQTTTGNGSDDYINFSPTFGARYVRVYCTAKVNPAWGYSLWEFEVSANITVTDTTPPVITIDPVTSPTNHDVTLTYHVSDNFSAPVHIIVTGDQSPYTTEGPHNVTLRATDEAGNWSQANVSFTIDKTPPAIDITAPLNNSGVNVTTIDVSGTINDAQALVEIEVIGQSTNRFPATNNGAGAFSSAGVTIEGNGQRNIVKAIATDAAGNSSQDSISIFKGWVLYMTLPNYYPKEILLPNHAFSSSGAATARMILDLMRPGSDTPTQLGIYDYGHQYNVASIDEMDPRAMDYTLGHFDSYDPSDPLGDGNIWLGYNFDIDAYESSQFNEYMRDIVHWMAYPVTKSYWWMYRGVSDLVEEPNTPAAVPAYGSYGHWLVINGAACDKAPFSAEPHINPWSVTDFTVYGLWFTDPLVVGGIGQNTYIIASECQSTTLLPLTSTDAYNGKYVQVSEPPIEPSNAKVSLAEPRVNDSTSELLKIAAYLSDESDPLKKHLLDKALVVNLNDEEELVSYDMDKDLQAIFKPDTENTTNIDWKEIIDPSLLSDDKFVYSIQGSVARTFIPVKRLDKDNNDYYIIPFDKFSEGQFLSYAAIIIDKKDGYFKQASWVSEPARFIQITKEEAIQKVLAQANIENPQDIQIQLVWSPELSDSPFYPVWMVTIQDKTFYVNQKGEVR